MRAMIFAIVIGAMCGSDANADQDKQAVKRALRDLFAPCTQPNETDRYRCVCNRFCRTHFPADDDAAHVTVRLPIAEVGGLELNMTSAGAPMSCSYTTMQAEVLASSVCKAERSAAKPNRR